MDDVRGVAYQRQSFANKFACGKKPERKCASWPVSLELSELEAKAFFEFGVKYKAGKRDDARGCACALRPYNRAAPAGQRQDRERPRRQKMLFSTAIMLALMRDCRDDRRLVIAPAVG